MRVLRTALLASVNLRFERGNAIVPVIGIVTVALGRRHVSSDPATTI